MAQNSGNGRSRPLSVGIVGGGFGGIGMGIRLKESGIDDFTIFERGDSVGGTWRANTYPGAACDVPSHLYSFSFAPNPDWTSTYAKQPEILAYLERCADTFGLRPHLRLDTAIVDATWRDEDATATSAPRRSAWHLTDEHGDGHDVDVLVSALGMLDVPSRPAIDGLDEFAGPLFHSAEWDHDLDLAGKRVAVIGTGASAIQFVPEIAPVAGRTTVFQRSGAH